MTGCFTRWLETVAPQFCGHYLRFRLDLSLSIIITSNCTSFVVFRYTTMSHSTIQSGSVQLSIVDDQDYESCDTEESPHSEVNLKRTCSSVISQPSVNLSIDLAASISGRLHPVHALNVAVVLEELSDRLAVLGKGLSAPMIDLRTDSSILFDQAHRPKVNLGGSTRISGGEWILRQRYDTVLPRRLQQLHRSVQTHRMNIGDSVKGNATLHHTDHGKAEISRAFAQDVIDRTLAEVVQERAFQTLIHAVRSIQRKQLQDSNHVKSYWRNKQEIKRLKAELKKLSLDNVAETKRFKMALWTLQDSLQEHNIRCTLENKYTAQACEMRRSKSKKLCAAEENIVYEALVDMKKKYQFEYSVHAAMLDIINKMKSEAEAKLEYWLDKYEVDKESLTRSLDSLKAERAHCLERIAWIHEITANYKPIVKDDRRVKKIEADRLARLELMTKRAIRIQAWWRGTMVRKGLGPFSRKNIKKDTQKKAGRKKKAKKK